MSFRNINWIFTSIIPVILILFLSIIPVKILIAQAIDDRALSRSINSDYVLHIQKIEGEIVLDGVIDEEDWLRADVAKDFFMVTPYDTSYSAAKSEIRMAYDDNAIYLALDIF